MWTWFLGGAQVAAADRPEPLSLTAKYAVQAEPGVPGMLAATGPFVRRTNWHRDPMAMGAYVNFRPGQLTRFGRLIWTEVNGIVKPP
ncbi:hypothetical protein, partial [Pseudomonas sp. FW305-53]